MMTDNLRAAVFMMTGSSAFAVNDTFLKLLGDNLGMFQIITMRGVVVSLIFALLLWMQRAKISALVPKDRWLLAMRSGAEMGGGVLLLQRVVPHALGRRSRPFCRSCR